MNMRFALALCACLAAAGAEAQGFDTFNQSSFARAAVLPALTAEPPLATGTQVSRVTLDWSNESYERSSARESLTLDAETQRIAFSHRRALAPGWQWSAELPLVFTGGGALDSLIEGWHSLFGLPNGNRDSRPQNAYRIRYVRDGVTLLDLNQGDNGLGDARLGISHAFSDQFSLHALLQLPTGSRQHLTGGHVGAALWARYRTTLVDTSRATLELAAGVSAAETKGPLKSLQAPILTLGSAAITLPLFGALDGVVQVSGHSAPYEHSSLSPLGKASMQLTFGLRYRFAGATLDAAVQEDPAVNASPDFGLHVSLEFGG